MRSSVRTSSARPVSPGTGDAEIQRVLHVARRVIGRHVQRVEAVPLVLDLRAFDDREAHAREDGFHPIADERSADGDGRARRTRPGSVTSTASAGRAPDAGALDATPSSAPRSPASARWRAGRCRACRRRRARDRLHPGRRRRCLCARGTGRGPPAPRGRDFAVASSARTRRSEPERASGIRSWNLE